MEVEEGAAVRAYLTERSTMIILGPALAMQSVFSLAARPRG